ncbi:uncharacterized protein [Tenebrio molitor]|uniref:uncharacterized protein n=1 Tax=Tenebrio molitor TaxID=7067 RepID=UPI003624AC1D
MNNVGDTEDRVLWNRESTSDLIELYKKYPVLYAPKHGNYKNKRKRLEVLKVIRSDMNRRGRKMTVEDIRKKIQGLRTQYAHQLSKIRKSQLSGAKPENIYKPKLWCFGQLEFLRHSDSSVDCESQADQDDDSLHESQDFGQHGEETQEMKNFYKEICLMNRKERASTRISPEISGFVPGGTNERVEDDLSTFGRLVEFELRKICNRQLLRRAKKEIIHILMDAQEVCDY